LRRIRPVTVAATSGLLLGLGVTVLLQQFAVWTLTVLTLVVLPLAVAGAGACVAWLAQRRSEVSP